MRQLATTMGLFAIALVPALTGPNASNATTSEVGPAVSQVYAGGVIALRDIKIKEGVDMDEFERYVAGQLVPAYQAFVPGMQVFVMKADRGLEKGKYVLAYTFDTAATRDYYFPEEGGPASDAYFTVHEPASDVFEGFLEFVDLGDQAVQYTDFVAIR